MMCDIERIEVLMYDVRMQLVDVLRWPCPRGEGSEKWVPYKARCSSVVKIGGFPPLKMDVQGFYCFPS